MSSDEFESYDFSEFTADDIAAIDAHIANARGGPAIQIATPDSPLQQFRSWRKHLAATEVVFPLWCEVQYEYNLYGKYHKPLEHRPSSFTSKAGKQIHVHRQVAHENNRRLKRGKSVHKALEDELHPVKRAVTVTSSEERFGLRLLELIDGFNELVTNGITRELPVFVITHGQVITGVIDEVLRSAPTQVAQSQPIFPTSPSSPPFSPPKKKQRCSSSSTLQQMISSDSNSLFSPSAVSSAFGVWPTKNQAHPTLPCEPGNSYELRLIDYKTRKFSNIPSDEDSLSPRLQLMLYHRMLSSLLEPETLNFNLLWKRLDLNPAKSFSAQFVKDINWQQRRADLTDLNVNLNRLVSVWISMVQRQRPALTGVSRDLQLVYRRSVFAKKQREKGKRQVAEIVERDDLLEVLALQEELDLARAIEQSLGGIGCKEAGQVADRIAQIVKQVGPSSIGHASAIWKDLISPLDSDQGDPILAWAIQQSLLTCARKACDQMLTGNIHDTHINDDEEPRMPDETKPAMSGSDGQGQKQASADISPIIGVKKFEMNDKELDDHVADVLQWWLGARPARGVDVAQTNRCFTCEYQNSCEWREQKAKEAMTVAVERTRRQNGAAE